MLGILQRCCNITPAMVPALSVSCLPGVKGNAFFLLLLAACYHTRTCEQKTQQPPVKKSMYLIFRSEAIIPIFLICTPTLVSTQSIMNAGKAPLNEFKCCCMFFFITHIEMHFQMNVEVASFDDSSFSSFFFATGIFW